MSFFRSIKPIEQESDAPVSALVHGCPADFRADFDRRSFSFSHRIAHDPLFDISRLTQAAEKILRGPRPDLLSIYDVSTVTTATKFKDIPSLESASDAIREIGTSGLCGTWIEMRSINEVDAEYEALLEPLLEEIGSLVGAPLREDIGWTGLTIYLSSPGAVMPYHIDHTPSFLFQIRGETDYCSFPKNHSELLSEDALERYYVGQAEAVNYREDLQNMGTVYRLRPGLALHQPSLAPHWLRNADAVAVRVRITLHLRSLDRQAKVYQANRCLRYLGLTPSPPGRSRLLDNLKSALLTAVSKRNPIGSQEMLFSGIERLRAPLRLARRLRGQPLLES